MLPALTIIDNPAVTIICSDHTTSHTNNHTALSAALSASLSASLKDGGPLARQEQEIQAKKRQQAEYESALEARIDQCELEVFG